MAKGKSIGDKLYFDDFLSGWVPSNAISTYLNSTARIVVSDSKTPEWLNYLKEMWVGNLGVFSPDYFDGVEMTNEFDKHGLPVFIRTSSSIYELLTLGGTSINTHIKKVKSDYLY